MISDIKSNLIPKHLHGFFSKKALDTKQYPLPIDFSFSNKQEKKVTLRNRQLAAETLGCRVDNICFLNQIHSSKVLFVDKTSTQLFEKADGMVTNTNGIGLAILTADCAPLLFLDPIAKVIGAAHAGWRGALYGVAENTVDAMVKIGATKRNILAAIGPCITQNNYEVREGFKDKIILNNGINEKYFLKQSNKKYLFDLSGFIINNLENHGVKTVSSVKLCTYEQRNNFHSYRHAQHRGYANHQRNMSLIRL